MMESGYFNNRNFQEYSYFAGGGLLSWNRNSLCPCLPLEGYNSLDM